MHDSEKPMTNQYLEYIQTAHWKMIAEEVKKRAGHRCQVCNRDSELEAHHRTYRNLYHESENMGDLTCLCRRCHGLFHESNKPPQQQKPKPLTTRKAIECQNRPEPQFFGADVVLTKKLIHACRTHRKGFSGPTIRAFGLSFPLPAKWSKRLVGTKISSEAYRAAFAGRLATIR